MASIHLFTLSALLSAFAGLGLSIPQPAAGQNNIGEPMPGRIAFDAVHPEPWEGKLENHGQLEFHLPPLPARVPEFPLPSWTKVGESEGTGSVNYAYSLGPDCRPVEPPTGSFTYRGTTRRLINGRADDEFYIEPNLEPWYTEFYNAFCGSEPTATVSFSPRGLLLGELLALRIPIDQKTYTDFFLPDSRGTVKLDPRA